MDASERRACKVIGQSRMTQRYKTKQPDKDKALTTEIKKLAKRHKRYGCRMITDKLRQDGWVVNHKRAQRIVALSKRLNIPITYGHMIL